MKTRHSMLRGALVAIALLAPLGICADTNSTTTGPGPLSLSHVRIVRLSFVQGDVAIRRPSETDWSAATVNTPIQEGFSVATQDNSFAEVEFENGSTARIGQNSEMDFSELALSSQGDKINKLALTEGYATFHFTPEHHDQYEVDASGVAMTVHGKAEFRTNFSGDALHVEVFDGQVTAQDNGTSEEVTKNRVLTYDPNAVEAMNVSSGVEKDSWDKWTQARDQQSVLANNDESVSLNNSLYGWGDLDTYGDWSFFPGYGYGWSPYEPAGWSPYGSGAFGYYPGWGFTWISAEPWGWLPYHNGFWNYDASMGWFWMPGPLDAWSPAAVNWYQGPGWVGWTPIGSGAASCSVASPGCLTAVAPGTLLSGAPLRPTSPIVIHPIGAVGITRIAPPEFVPGTAKAGVSSSLSHAPVAAAALSVRAPATATMHAAPTSVVMGREVTPDAFLGHHGFFSGPQAIHTQLGHTMGGTVPIVVAHNGEVTPDSHYHPVGTTAASGSSAGSFARVPVVMAHGEGASVGAHGGVSAPPAPSVSSTSVSSASSTSVNSPSASSSGSSAASSSSARSSGSISPAPAGGHR
jgi:hypothetical protein